MADWFVEEGIAEHRAVRIAAGQIVEARIAWPGRLAAGTIVETRLTSRAAGSNRGTSISPTGEEILVDRLPREASEGASIRLAIVRAALDGTGRLKRAQGRPSSGAPAQPSLVEMLRAANDTVTVVRRFAEGDWDELLAEASSGEIDFPGGALLLAPTAALTTIDIDGTLPPRTLALAAVPVIANALRRLAIAGSIVVDFPTLADKADRRAVDEALGAALGEWPHERTAMNGFGLVQIVSRLEGPSLLQLATWRRGPFAWRQLLRRAEALTGPGKVELSISPAIEAAVEPAHLTELERRTGKTVRVRIIPGLALEASHAQLVGDD